MPEPVFKMIDLVGTSQDSISDAIDNAILKASRSLRHLGWFEVKEIRGSIAEGEVGRYQVTIKAGFTLEDVADDEE